MVRWFTYWGALALMASLLITHGARAEDNSFVHEDDTFDTTEPLRPSADNEDNQAVNIPVPPAACQSLGSAICGNVQPQVKAQQAQQLGNTLLNTYVRSRVQQLTGNLGNSFAAQATGQRFSQVFDGALQGALQNPLFQSVFKDYYDFASRQLPDLKSIVDPIVDSLEKAIDKSGFDDRDKIAMRAKIEGVHFRYEPNFNDPDDIREFLQACGFGGLAQNAQAAPERNEVFICPGMMLHAIATSGYKDAVWGIFHVVAHETGHMIGADQENPFLRAHLNTFACLEQRMPFQLNDQERSETTADWFADEALNERLEDSGITGAAAFRDVKWALTGLCGTPSEGIHPDGLARHLIASWSVGATLGCKNTRPQCTPDGTNGDLDVGFRSVAPVSDAGLQFTGDGGNRSLGGGTNSPLDPNLQQALSNVFGLNRLGGQNQGGFGLQGGGGGFGLQGAGNIGQFSNLSLLGNQLTPEQQILARLGLNGGQTSGFNGFDQFGNVSPFTNNGFGLGGFRRFGNQVFFQGGPFSRFIGFGF